MRIAIDCSKAINEKAGIARYTRELALHLADNYKDDEFLFYFNFVRDMNKKTQEVVNFIGNRKNVKYVIQSLPGQLKELIFPSRISYLNKLLKSYDIYHATEFLSFDRGLKIPQVLTVHDLSTLRFPNHRGAKESNKHTQMLKSACANSSAIISVSNSTKDDVIKYFNTNSGKITSIFLGYDEIFRQIKNPDDSSKILKMYKIKSPYLLFVGTIEPRKNIENLVVAFNKFKQTAAGKNYQLVLAGSRGWNSELIYKQIESSQSKNDIILLGHVADDDLVHLFNQTSLFCYPSIFEGFGLPVLEAMACGAPVLTSNVSSLPEVGGDAAEYVDPESSEKIFNSLERIIGNKKMLGEMSKKSLAQSKKFSWNKNAIETHKLYEKILEK
jgi:glycosyltransferase involved in cell wall biosynthesis